MRFVSLIGILLVLCTAGRAQTNARVFDVRAFGAKGDNVAIDSPAINQAIEAAAASGGGTVFFPTGNYLSFSIRLKSHITLLFDSGATLVAAEPPPDLSSGYDAPEPNPGTDQWEDFGHSHWHNSLIWGEGLEDIAIVGPGRIYGRGLSLGRGRRALTPEEYNLPKEQWPDVSLPKAQREAIAGQKSGPFGYPGSDTLPAGVGNKAIALKNCRNVIFRDFTIYHGGHFAILATGVDNWTVDGLKIDTNRDGIDLDCCQNVRFSNCTINSPGDDAICLKSSYGLGYARMTENVTITNCQVSGYDEGTLLDGRRLRARTYHEGPTGRIKFGTESNGGFRNITIANCVFDYCRGLALESVDGAIMEDITVSNLTMRDIVNAPIFIRLGKRLRGPNGTAIGAARRIKIDTVVAHNVSVQHGILIIGEPDASVEDVSLSNLLINYAGGGTAADAAREVPAYEKERYPEPYQFGRLPSWGLYARYVRNLRLDRVELRTLQPDQRPRLMLKQVAGLDIHRCQGLPELSGGELIDDGKFP